MTTTPIGVATFLQPEAVGSNPFVEETPDRIRQGRDFAQSAGHPGDAFVVEFQTLDHRGAEAGLGTRDQVTFVGFLDGGRVLLQAVRHREQARIFRVRR